MRLFFIALGLLASINAWANCGTQLLSANFSLSVNPNAMLDGNTIKQSALTNLSLLYFQATTQQNTPNTITHRWTSSRGVSQHYSITVKQGKWQSWSAVNLPATQQNWRVEVFDNKQCLLGRFELNVLDDDAILQQVREAIASEQLTEAKLMLNEAINTSRTLAQKRHREAFLATDFVLAEAENNIKNKQFIAAAGRLDSLQGKLANDLEEQRLLLLKRLQIMQSLADNEARLKAKWALLLTALFEQQCPLNLTHANFLLKQQNQPITLSSYAQKDNQADIQAQLPSGKIYQTTWRCAFIDVKRPSRFYLVVGQ